MVSGNLYRRTHTFDPISNWRYFCTLWLLEDINIRSAMTSARRIIRECLELFEAFICREWIQPPTSEEERQTMEEFFTKTGFPRVMGCVAGTHIRIKEPGADIKHLYYNRKGYYSINAMVQALHYKFVGWRLQAKAIFNDSV
ncbi:uncharacterized protein LOC131994876 [Stomoxys calcitrans]|uniref:uncharacterized protein LOC131994876 n=1 Tax=Stomoxys calcitrans TaxID=35570 RepID=UPI0027E21871|nr:uncharacterized protein LOC131994876 [Stomoxys calcitrans]